MTAPRPVAVDMNDTRADATTEAIPDRCYAGKKDRGVNVKGVLPTPSWIDDVLADSFPASDPPSWTLGVAKPDPTVSPAGRAATPTLPASPTQHDRAERQGSDMIQARGLVPHFTVSNFQGERVQYSSVWQRKNLVLVMLPDVEASSRTYADRLMARVRTLDEDDTEWVITADRVGGLPCPGVVIADRWGEVVHLESPSDTADLPTPDELLEWVHYLQHQCPECEGEAR
jgi:hypothetical protein